MGSFISLQTNVTSLHAQQDMNVNDAFQNNTILQLSSGYRINSSADDPAGLAVANQYNSDIAEAQQGVRNANDGLSQLQIVDGGLGNISTILNQLKSLATESASGTFTGNRGTLNLEYQSLVSEITRQADNIQLNAGGNLNTQLSVYIGGNRTSNVTGTGVVKIDLSGSANAVDATSLGLQGTTVIGGGTSFNATNTVTNLSNANALFNIAVGTGTNAGDGNIRGDIRYRGRHRGHQHHQCPGDRDRRHRVRICDVSQHGPYQRRNHWYHGPDRSEWRSAVQRWRSAVGCSRHVRHCADRPRRHQRRDTSSTARTIRPPAPLRESPSPRTRKPLTSQWAARTTLFR